MGTTGMTGMTGKGEGSGGHQGSGASSNTPGEAEAVEREEAEAVEARVRKLARAARGSGDSDAFWVGYRTHAFEMVESGGLPESRVGLEVLFMLPSAFVNFYSDLFGRALRVDDGSVMHGRSGGLEKAKGEGGMVTGSSTKLQAGGGGKKWKNTPMAIGNEQALKVKEKVDAGLQALMKDCQPDLASGSTGAIQCSGTLAGVAGVDLGLNGEARKCRQFLKGSWKFCPGCGTAVDKTRK